MDTTAVAAISHEDRQAVAIALSDARRAGTVVATRSRWTRFFAAVTGNEPLRPLANPRLEAIRGFVSAVLRGDRAERLAEALAAQGINPAQIRTLALRLA